MPVAGEVGAAGDADLFRGAKMFEVGDCDGIGRTAFEPLGGVDGVPQFPAADKHVDAVLPEAVVDEANRERATDAESF